MYLKHFPYSILVLFGISVFYVMLYGVPFYTEEETMSLQETAYHKLESYIRLDGPLNETVYQNAAYLDPGAEVMEEVDGEIKCSGIFIKSSKPLNTRMPGIYLMEYKAEDSKGKILPTLTRTVQVIANEAAFLNGIYNVACSCTAVIGSSSPVVKKTDYIAAVSSGSKNYEFELNKLRVGELDVIPFTKLNEDRIEAFYYNEDFDLVKSSVSGTLSSTKNTFTIESHAIKNYPYESYHCLNVFSNTKWQYENTK